MQWSWNKKKWTGSSICLLILGSSVYFYNMENTPQEHPLAFSEAKPSVQEDARQEQQSAEVKQNPDPTRQTTVPAPTTFVIDVKGAVVSPGVYTLSADARVYQAIGMAGGLLPEADAKQVNGAQKLVDGMMIYIPLKGEQISPAGHATPGSVTGSTPAVGTQGKEEAKVDLNTATVEQLQTIPGIGPRKAEAIVQYREEHGPFKTIDSLTGVAGIGAKTVEKMRAGIFVQ
ncbi:helix-hairpin-helix domain-containing protein [Aneurinibacillus sp. REN35]|uniref:helix-hairpin-helix domain-containing protein n=2 Tax=Paenibacillaceae TaxID=186822 RepID=UPI003526FAAF